jgi:hypothetical protein
VLYLICFPIVFTCTVTGRLLPQPLDEPTPALSTTTEPAAMETATFTPTATRKTTSTPTPPCVPPLGSDYMRLVQDEADTLIPGGKVIWFDDFLCSDLGYGWGVGYQNPNTKVTVGDGVLTFSTREAKNVWDGIGRNEWNIQDRTGFLLLFRSVEKTSANIILASGTWQTPDFRRWGFEIRLAETRSAIWSGFEGVRWIDGGSPVQNFKPNVWYYLLIRLGEAGQVTMRLWEKDRIENHADFNRVMGSGWIGRRWMVLFQVYDGTIQLDRYWEAAFDGEK